MMILQIMQQPLKNLLMMREKWWMRYYFVIDFLSVCDVSWKICLKWRWRYHKYSIPGCPMVIVCPTHYGLFLTWIINTHGMTIHRETLVRQTDGQWSIIFFQWINNYWLQLVIESFLMNLDLASKEYMHFY